MKKFSLIQVAIVSTIACTTLSAQASEWSDFSLAYSYGTQYREPFNASKITKNTVTANYVSGDAWGTNFFNTDVLMSNKNESRATEVYAVYRRMFDFGKISKKDLSFGPVRTVGATVGFDLNSKNDPSYGSRKRLLVAGPTVSMAVPKGFVNASVLAYWESNDPAARKLTSRYSYKTHPALDVSWGVPIGDTNFQFNGFAQYIAAKGKNEFGGKTYPESRINARLMYDLGPATGLPKNTIKVGVGYDYWRAKFGNNPKTTGTVAKAPYVRAEYHF